MDSANLYDFITLCAKGECELDEVDDFVEAWHHSNSPLPLHVFLGFSSEDYNIWLFKPEYLKAVVIDRKVALGLLQN